MGRHNGPVEPPMPFTLLIANGKRTGLFSTEANGKIKQSL